MKSALTIFCESKGVPENIRDAFAAYMRNVYANRYLLRGDTDTIRIMINRLGDEKLEQAWQEFISDLRKYLTE